MVDNATSVEVLEEDAGTPSPPTHRVILVISLLSQYPDRPHTLAEIVRETGLSRATAHAVVAQLVVDGWVRREAEGFRLGRAMLSIARGAQAAFPLRQSAAPALERLHAELGMPVFAVERDGDFIEVIGVIGVPPTFWVTPERRLPLCPPVCREFFAYGSPAEKQEWISGAPEEVRDRLSRVLDAVATRGYALERLAQDANRMLDILRFMRESSDLGAARADITRLFAALVTIDYLPEELADPTATVSVATVGAPIFAAGTVVGSLVACPDSQLTAGMVGSIGDTLRAAAASVPTV